MFKFIIKEKEGQRLDVFLSNQQELGQSRSQVAKLIDDTHVLVNKKEAKPSYKLRLDDVVEVTVPEPKKLEAKPENIPLDIIYEDKDLIVINKPRGMVVHPAAGNYSGTLVNALLYHCKDLSGIGGVLRPGIVHRLDKDTSGLLVVAKNDFTHKALAKQFKEHKILKQYVALVHGVMKKDQGRVEAAIGRHPIHRKKMAVKMGGRESVSLYKVLERFKAHTLVEITLKTGRTHQIRVHLQHLGHPIVGDPVYGKQKGKGQLLHAAKLGFVHPRTDKYLEFSQDLPKDMEQFLKESNI